MIPTYTNSFSSSSSPSFPFEINNEVHDHIPHVSTYNNYQVASSSSNSSCQTFFNISTTNDQVDQTGYNYHSQFHQPQHQHEVDNFASRSGSYDHLEKKNKSLKLTLWKKGVKKMKNCNGASMEVANTTTTHTNIKLKLEDQKQQMETDNSSNSSSNNIPIRVCSDCNTTKTPLWRSGPKGPKSLCNACGIRQRKARRAMAAAAAAAATTNGTNFTSTETSTTTTMKIKVQQQKQKITKVNTNHVVPFKKRCKFLSTTSTAPAPVPGPAPVPVPGVGSSSWSDNNNNAQQNKKLCFEDFFMNLSNNLVIHRVFPQDEKEAAILLMALSSGLVHG